MIQRDAKASSPGGGVGGVVKTAGGSRNISLQALRGAAACSVMIYHASHFTTQKTGALWLEEAFSSRLGLYGVLVFFVLSGFLMEGAVRRYDATTFVLHRFVRLYPTYWVLFFLFFLIQSFRIGTWDVVPWKALTLLPLGEMFRPLHAEWTLLYEVFFYAICAVACVWKRVYPPVLLVWLTIVAVAFFAFGQYGTSMQPTLLQIPFSVWNVGFICGSLGGIRNRSKWRSDPALLWLAGVSLVLLGELAMPGTKLFLAGPGFTCIVVALVRAPRMTEPGIGMRVMFLLGEYSYGLYLAHALSIQLVLVYLPASLWSQPVAVFAGMIGVGLGVGILAGSIDVALYGVLKNRIDHWSRRRLAAREARAALTTADTAGAVSQPTEIA